MKEIGDTIYGFKRVNHYTHVEYIPYKGKIVDIVTGASNLAKSITIEIEALENLRTTLTSYDTNVYRNRQFEFFLSDETFASLLDNRTNDTKLLLDTFKKEYDTLRDFANNISKKVQAYKAYGYKNV